MHLIREIEKVRVNKVAIDDEETPEGVYCVACTDTQLQRKMCGGHQYFSSEKSGTPQKQVQRF